MGYTMDIYYQPWLSIYSRIAAPRESTTKSWKSTFGSWKWMNLPKFFHLFKKDPVSGSMIAFVFVESRNHLVNKDSHSGSPWDPRVGANHWFLLMLISSQNAPPALADPCQPPGRWPWAPIVKVMDSGNDNIIKAWLKLKLKPPV